MRAVTSGTSRRRRSGCPPSRWWLLLVALPGFGCGSDDDADHAAPDVAAYCEDDHTGTVDSARAEELARCYVGVADLRLAVITSQSWVTPNGLGDWNIELRDDVGGGYAHVSVWHYGLSGTWASDLDYTCEASPLANASSALVVPDAAARIDVLEPGYPGEITYLYDQRMHCITGEQIRLLTVMLDDGTMEVGSVRFYYFEHDDDGGFVQVCGPCESEPAEDCAPCMLEVPAWNLKSLGRSPLPAVRLHRAGRGHAVERAA